jgi:hypothetical protein
VDCPRTSEDWMKRVGNQTKEKQRDWEWKFD